MIKDNFINSKENEIESSEKPNRDIKPPEYMIVTEGFDPAKVNKLIRKVIQEDK